VADHLFTPLAIALRRAAMLGAAAPSLVIENLAIEAVERVLVAITGGMPGVQCERRMTTRRLKRILDHFEARLAEQIHLPDLARDIGLSESYLARTFRAVSDTDWLRLWDIIAGISTAAYDPTVKADIINLSLGCVSLIGTCSVCGTSGTNRSTVFENFLKNIGGKAGNNLADPVFVCSVGNDDASIAAATSFEWPAQYKSTLAVGAINTKKDKSSFSKTGTIKNDYFMCPGGDFDTATSTINEWVGEGKDNKTVTKCIGTSPAAAYASGVLALYRQKFLKDLNASSLGSRELLDGAFHRCVHDISGYSTNDHGHGRLVYDTASYPP
jgi:Subtilase family